MTHSVDELCRRHSLTIDDLVERSGLDAAKVTAIALGRWTPSPAERERIAAVFELTPDDVCWGHKTPIQHLYGHGPT